MWASDSETFPKRILANVGIYHIKKFQNKQAKFTTLHGRVWEIMVITEHVNSEFRVLKLILCGI